MTFENIDANQYHDAIRQGRSNAEDYTSPDGQFQLKLIYAGEYMRGDSWNYAEIIRTDTNEVIWEYKKGDEIRGSVIRPWSADSTSCYFTVINNGDRIMRYDRITNKLISIYGSAKQNKLKGIEFVPRNFNGVVFHDNASGKVLRVDVYAYLADTETYFRVNDHISDEHFIVSECGLPDCIVTICHGTMKLFNVRDQNIVREHRIDNADLTRFKRGYSHYTPHDDAIYCNFLTEEGWKYYRLAYR